MAKETITSIQDVHHIRATSGKLRGSMIREEIVDDVRYIGVQWRGHGKAVYRVESFRVIAGGHVWTVTPIFEGL